MQLTADCLSVQIKGLPACKKCPYKGKEDCGGGMTLKAMKKGKKAIQSRSTKPVRNDFLGECDHSWVDVNNDSSITGKEVCRKCGKKRRI